MAARSRITAATMPSTRTSCSTRSPRRCCRPRWSGWRTSGIEPWLRRHWPTSLISWSRLLGGGRARSPGRPRPADRRSLRRRHRRSTSSLSRDVVAAITGLPPGPMFNGVVLLTSPRWVIAGVLGSAANSLLNGVLLSHALRRAAPAAAPPADRPRSPPTVVLALLIFSDDWRPDTLARLRSSRWGWSALLLLPLLRFGLLPFTVAWWTNSVAADATC